MQKYRDDKFDVEQKTLVYKVRALKTKSVAERSQIHSAYFQTVRDIREKHLEKASEFFYRIQRDRFKTDESTPNYSIPFPTRRSQQITQQTAYNREVSVLSGVAKYVGFPAAPEATTARQAELNEDMEKMGVSFPVSFCPRGVSTDNVQISADPVRPHRARPAPLSRTTFPSVMSRPAAEEQFLEQTPWANPQHPIHHHVHRMSRQPSEQTTPGAPSLTPSGQKRVIDLSLQKGSASTTHENPSAAASANTPQGAEQDQDAPVHTEVDAPARGSSELVVNVQSQLNSPSEYRRANMAAPLSKELCKTETSARTVEQATGQTTTSPPMSRLSLFSSPTRPGPIHPQRISRHETASPMGLSQHVRETSITAGSGYRRFAAL